MKGKYFIIFKETVSRRCEYCGGGGKVEVKLYHNQYETVQCPHCYGEGTVEKEETTEVELTEALKELGHGNY